ncbi:MAG: hypothetical protein E6604_08335 [Veillonella sp.]|nr:hypothetical protein [Veillonella sp.]
MAEVTFNNQPIHLLGSEVQQGDQAPNFTVLANDLSEVTLDTYQDKIPLVPINNNEVILVEDHGYTVLTEKK